MLPYKNAKNSPARRVEDLLARMTVAEKIGQLCKLDGFESYRRSGNRFEITEKFQDTFATCPIGSMYGLLRADWWTRRDWASGVPPERMREVGGMFQRHVLEHSRLGIPLYLAEEAGHGLMALGMTVFPTGLGLGSCWDDDLLEQIGAAIGAEARSAGIAAVYAPLLDVIRDPRWSRAEENFSEDPLLTARAGAALIRGIVRHGIVATLKHFAGHGSPEGGHNSFTSHLGPVELRNCQLRPFRAAIRAGARSVMSAYSDVDGEPATGSYRLLTEILRDELGFDGFVVSDRGAIMRLVSNRLAGDQAEASARAIRSGCDVDEGFLELHRDGLLEALARGLIREDDLDRAAGRLLKVKFEIGLFEHPYPPETVAIAEVTRANRPLTLTAALKSMTLLKNNGILPLRHIRKLALIGPNADHVMNQLGDYTAPQRADDVVTLRDALAERAAAGQFELAYAPGCRIRHDDDSGFAAAERAARDCDAIVLVLGGASTMYGNAVTRSETGAAVIAEILDDAVCDKESGEGTDRGTLHFLGAQTALFRRLRQLGKPLIAVLIQGRPLWSDEVMEQADAVLLAWYPGMAGGEAIARCLFGEYNPAGRLPLSIPRHPGQIPVFYNTMNPRPEYLDLPGAPALEFGFGLSYTTFAYEDLRVADGVISVRVANTGTVAGEEVVQFYLTDLVASIQRPWKELCGYQRIFLAPGESRRVSCPLTAEQLGFYDSNGQWRCEAGEFRIYAGGSLRHAVETVWHWQPEGKEAGDEWD